MPLYALRIVCRKCGAASLLGGCPENDLSRWRHSTVECRRCGTDTSAADAEAVNLRAFPADAEALEDRVEDPVHA
jgi:ribosomal protein L37E